MTSVARSQQEPIAVLGAARTPMGGFQGALAGMTATALGAAAIRASLDRAAVDPADVGETLMGCVLPAGLGQAPARQAALGAGLPQDAPCTTVNKMCGSGMKAAMLAMDGLRAGEGRVAVAGGMESMSNAPYLAPKMRAGARLGHAAMQDHMFLDGLEDAYEPGRLMGTYAEDCAERYQFTRVAQDDYALASLTRALAAQERGALAAEIAPVTVKTRKGETVVAADEQPASARPDRIPHLKPAFREGGTVTPANSSSISDGAAALTLMRAGDAEVESRTPVALLRAHASHAQAPGLFTTAPVFAIRKLLDRMGWAVEDVDLWEINEAFAVVPMAAMRELRLDHDRVNVLGGACALGHPIGASGARIMVTLINAMAARHARRGVAAICIGGGEATAVAVTRD
jgi:acetyl-CoA C-acetyltransferase